MKLKWEKKKNLVSEIYLNIVLKWKATRIVAKLYRRLPEWINTRMEKGTKEKKIMDKEDDEWEGYNFVIVLYSAFDLPPVRIENERFLLTER